MLGYSFDMKVELPTFYPLKAESTQVVRSYLGLIPEQTSGYTELELTSDIVVFTTPD